MVDNLIADRSSDSYAFIRFVASVKEPLPTPKSVCMQVKPFSANMDDKFVIPFDEQSSHALAEIKTSGVGAVLGADCGGRRNIEAVEEKRRWARPKIWSGRETVVRRSRQQQLNI